MTNIEIERKYLVRNDSFMQVAVKATHITQAYLSSDPHCTVRCRRFDDQACLTIKGSNSQDGIEHFEWEKPISIADVEALLPLCRGGVIDKERYFVPFEDLMIEIDVFHGQNEGLVLAEIELPASDYSIPVLPDFIGEEVTTDPRYYNSYLSSNPYKNWK